MAEELICSKPGCGGRVIDGVCLVCGQKKETSTGRDKPRNSVGFGFTTPVGGTSGESGSSPSGGFCNG